MHGNDQVLNSGEDRRQVGHAGCARIDFHASAIASARDTPPKFAVDGVGDFARGRKIRLTQKQRNRSETIEIEGQTTFYPPARRNSSDGWMVHLLARTRTSSGKPSDCNRALGCGVDLPIRAIELREQKEAAFEALGIADRGDGYVHLRAGPRECRQAGSHKYRCDIVDARRRRRNRCAHALHNVGQGLGRERGLLAVSGTRESNHHAIANQRIFPYAFDAGQIADFHRDRFGRRDRSGICEHYH